MGKDISELSVAELKALAYDDFVSLQRHEQNLRLIQQELSKRPESPADSPAIVESA